MDIVSLPDRNTKKKSMGKETIRYFRETPTNESEIKIKNLDSSEMVISLPKKLNENNRSEKRKNLTETPANDLEMKKKKPYSSEIIKLRPKKLNKEKKKVVKELKSLHEILGNTKPPDEEELELQQIVFGGGIDDFEKDTETIPAELKKTKKTKSKAKSAIKKPAWVDEDDQTILVKEKADSLRNVHRSVTVRGEEKYSDFVQEKFKKLIGEPEWAELGRKIKDSDDDSEDELLKKTGNILKKSEHLSKGFISIRKCSSLTHETMNGAIVKSVEFHPTSRVALVTGTNGIANLFQVDGKVNSKIQTIYLESFPIHTAHFTSDGNEIVAGSNMHGFFYTYDMLIGKLVRVPWDKGMEQRNIRRFQVSPDGKYIAIQGRYGNIHLLTTKTKEWIGSLKMNGEVVAITFSSDGTKLYSHGGSGEVYIWDVNSRKCLHKFIDEGCITGTSIAISPNNQFLATGSDSGIVNIYNCTDLNSSSPCPIKTVKNLTTEITTLKFNVTTELLAVGSSYKIGSVRLVHFPSQTVFSNFPAREDYKAMKNVNSLDISPGSGFLMMGNNTGNALIYRLKHFKNY